MQHLLVHKYFVLIPLGYTLLLTIGSLVKTVDLEYTPDHFDKVIHLGSYFVLAVLWFLWRYMKEGSTTSFFYIVLVLIAYGIFIEYVQGTYTTYRTSDVIDGLANTIGVLLAWFLMTLIFNKSQWLKSNN